ncbi:MAG: transposase [Gemmatimonadetes bacterium]|nr:MAG: transposase [Gemmatimonadota bacterium]
MDTARASLRVSHARRSIRLPGYDYSRPGAYFVTICTRDGEPLFGTVRARHVHLSAPGQAARSCWLEIPEHFADVTLDAFIVMPDHLHGIVIISGMLDRHSVGAQHAAPLRSIGRLPAPTGSEGCSHGSLGAIVRSFKSATTKRINEMRHTPEKRVWQRNYHDRIIRDDREMQRARHYVLLNPLRWKDAG